MVWEKQQLQLTYLHVWLHWEKSISYRHGSAGNMTSGLGIDKNEVKYTVYDLILGQVDIKKVICKNALENLDILPTNIDLSAAEIELIE